MYKLDRDNLHSIFLEIKNNKVASFNKLYENYRDLVYMIAFSVLKNKEDSEDVLQKVFIKIWNMENQKLPKSNETCWLYSITKNEAITLIRSKKALLNIDDLYYISEENDEINSIVDKDSYNRVISKLNPREQEIVSLKVLSNLSFKEISQMLNIPESTAKWKYYKSIHTLKLLLGNLGMFIITFATCLKSIFSSRKKTSESEVIEQENDVIPDSNTTSSDQHHTEPLENYVQDNAINSTVDNTTEQIIVEESVGENNYLGVGLGVSLIFFIFTIIFTIIFVKHQLNRIFKSSK